MDYEKEYKEALERAKEINNEHRAQPFDVMTRVFSELKESEDKKIRKEIISALKFANVKGVYDKHIAWLEKQGQTFTKEDIDKAFGKRELEKQGESKFEQCIQEGDKIVTNEDGTHFNVSQLERVAKKENLAWSEADEVRLTNIIIMLKEGASHHFVKGDITNSVDWLKSLKDRMKGE